MKYKTIKNACKKANRGEISLNNLISGRFDHVKKGWTLLRVDDIELEKLLDVIGGRKRDLIRQRIFNCGTYRIFDRLTYHIKYGWSYCAGQDYPGELATIRKLIGGK